MIPLLELVFWLSFAGLAWTLVVYPIVIGALSRARPQAVLGDDVTPVVTLIITAHDEQGVIAAKLDNALALDYPVDRLELVVASDASTDRTHEIVRGYAGRGVRLLEFPRGGKTVTQDRAVAATGGEILAFSDANAMWDAGALRRLVRPLADPAVGMVCGQLVLTGADGGTSQEGAYWRYEMWLRLQESRARSITGSNGAIYAVRRPAYVRIDPQVGHDLSFPYLIVQQGYRAVYEPSARAVERMATDIQDEFRRKVRQLSQSWRVVLRGGMWSPRVGPLYLLELVSHRLLRYASGLLHVAWFASAGALAPRGGVYLWAFVLQAAVLGLALVSMAVRGRVRLLRVPHHYLLLMLATLVGLVHSLQGRSAATWEKAVGTR
jgi:cellulose synthase/poly-beta-1,6-N-acetylglucosamine synthase-like glycosyltransferase